MKHLNNFSWKPIALVAFLCLFGRDMLAQDDANLSTDQPVYVAGTTVTFNGSGFNSGEIVTIEVERIESDGDTISTVTAPIEAVANDNGEFVAEWQVPVEESQYDAELMATAKGAESDRSAQIQFSGNIKVDFRQSANNDAGYGPNQIHWINSILQQSNSTYAEGMSSLQRVVLANIDATTDNVHTLQFGHQFSKGGHRAYDFLTGNSLDALTGWNVAYENANGIEAETIIGEYQCYEELGPPAGLVDLCNSLHTITSSNLASADEHVYDVELPNDPFPGVQQRINTFEALYGNRYMRIYGDQPIENAYFERVVHSDDDLGDSYVNYNLVVVSASTALIYELGGHLAIGGVSATDTLGLHWGLDQGAGSISGGPYHFKLYGLGAAPVADLNNYDLEEYVSLGAQDNQIKAGDIIPLTCECEITGATATVCPNSTHEYCAPEGTVNSVWSISGNGTIVGSGNCIEVMAGMSCGASYTLTLTSTNDLGCVTECSVTVVAEDTSAPEVSASGSVENETYLGANPTAEEIEAALGSATASDNCYSTPSITIVDGSVTINGCYRSQSRSFSSTDECGNTTTAIRMVTWLVDVTPPVITYTCASGVGVNTNLGCNPTTEEIEESLCTITVTDNCDEEVEVVITNDTVAGPGCTYTITRGVVATDRYGNTSQTTRGVTYKIDLDAPVLTASGSVEDGANLGGNPSAEEIDAALGTASAFDVCDGDLPVSTSDGNVVVDGCNYSQTRTFSAVDACGNESSISRNISWIVDLEEPVITYNCENTSTVTTDLGCNPSQTEIEESLCTITVTDNCDEEVVIVVTYDTIPGTGCTFTITRGVVATDRYGNTSQTTRGVTYKIDLDAPVLTASGSVEDGSDLGCNPTAEEIDAALGFATAEDFCDGELPVSSSDSNVSENGCARSQTRAFSAMDECGNESSVTRTISWKVDVTAPIFGELPAESTIDCPAMPELVEASVNDACGDFELAFTDVTTPGSCPANYSITRTWTATDACGNSSSASQTINVQDITAPVVLTPLADQFIQCQEEAVYGEPTFADACDNNLDVTYEVDSITLARGIRIIRSFTATDDCGNSVTDESAINIVIENNPVLLNLPELSEVVECGFIPQPPVVDGQDVCGNSLEINFEEVITGDNCYATITRTWTAVDSDGNVSSATQIITVQDTTSPEISAAGADATIECPAQPEFTAPTATDNCNDVQVVEVSDVTEAACGNTYSRTKTWKAIDACGNESGIVSQTITVVDITAPSISAAGADDTIECPTQPEFTAPSASDDCDSNPTVELVSDITSDGNCAGSYTQTKTWIAYDACGNYSETVSQTITVVDLTAPSISAAGADATIECPAEPAFTAPTASDNCSNAQVVEVSDVTEAGCGNTYSRTKTWKAIDACGNESGVVSQTINVVDTTAPVIEELFDITGSCIDGTSFGTAVATDNCGNVELSYVDEEICVYTTYSKGGWGSPSNSTPGQYRDNNFDAAFPNGLTIGCANGSFTFTSAQAIEDWLPSGGGSAVLPAGNLVNPSADVFSNNFADQLIAAMLNTGFDAYDENLGASGANLGNLTYASGTFAGMTINSVIAIANDVIGGCSSAYSGTALSAAMESINLSFHEGDDNSGDFVCAFGDEDNQCASIVERTWTATDECGNTSTATQRLTIIDDEAPVVSAAGADAIIECPAVPEFTAPTATDNCSDVSVIVISDVTEGTDCSYTRTITWAAADACGNRSQSVSQSITVIDNSAPQFTACPAALTVECSDELPAIASNVEATDNCSAVSVQYVGATSENGACSSTITRTWVATDACGNTTECSQIITILDTTAPQLNNLPASEISIECDAAVPAAAEVTIADNCDENPSLIFNETTVEGVCGYSIVRTWYGVDQCENVSETFTQTINIEDNTAPVFNAYEYYVHIACGETAAAPTATDNCGSVTVELIQDQLQSGGCLGVWYRVYRATDACGNYTDAEQFIAINDDLAPVLNGLPENATIECSDVVSNGNAGVTVSDNCDQEIEVIYTEEFIGQDDDCPETYDIIRTWVATDDCENTTTATRTTQVQDTTAPVFVDFPANITISCDEEIPAVVYPVATDNCDETVDVFFAEDMMPGSCPQNYFIYRVYRGHDNCGNEVVETQTITVVDETAPMFEEQANDFTYECNSVIPVIEPAAADNCGDITLTYIDSEVEGNSCYSTFMRMWTATDNCENSSMFVQSIHIQDTTAPVITGSYELDRPCGDYIGIYVEAADNCSEVNITYSDMMASGSCAGNVIRSYTATDLCGNVSATFTQVIHLIDEIAPEVAYQNEDMTVECGDEYSVVPASFTDSCDEELEITTDFSSQATDCTTIETYSWTATDHCGNTTTATTVVTIVDTTNPYFTSLPEDATISCEDVVPGFGIYAAADNCDSNVEIAVSESTLAGDCPQSYTLVRVYRAFDNCGNEAVETRYVFVMDETAPVFAEQNNAFTYECGADVPVIEPSATDNCGDVSLTYQDADFNGNTCQGVIVRTWSAADACGNNSSFTQYITIVDTQAPVVNAYEVEIDMPCDNVSNNVMITASDCNDFTIDFNDEYVSGGCAGRIIRTYTISDACGNVTAGLIQQIIELVDEVAPSVEVAPSDVTIECGEEVPSYEPVWSDNCDQELFLTAISGIAQDDCTTIISQSWTAVDHCGNSTTISRSVTIVDSTAPVFTSVPTNEERDCNADDVVATASAEDICSDVTVSHNDVVVPGSCPASYTVERTYTATDACGNSAYYTQYINVSDNTAPVWGENGNTFMYECGSEADVVTPAVSDNCSEYTLSYTDGNPTQGTCTPMFERSWIAVDACGNASAPFVQYISFEDTTEPVLNGCPENLVLNCNDELPTPASVTAFDGCDSDVQIFFDEQFIGDAPAEGSIADCNLITPARPTGNPCGYPYDWSMVMFGMPTAHRWYQVVDGSIAQYPGDSLHLVAQLDNVLNPGTGWNVDVWFNGGMDWSAWSNQSFPTSFKADCGGVDANFASWTYFLLQAGSGAEMAGYGNYTGSSINLVHAPANNYFGFQLGDGANNYNAADNGFGGWFSYNGSFRPNTNQSFTTISGGGDFAFELDCCPDYTIERQWTAIDCSGNTATCSQTISFSPSAASNGGNEGQSTIDQEAVSNERVGSTITVSPNPANTTALFTFKAANSAKTTVEVMDLTGKKVADVFMGTVDAGASYVVNFDVSNLATGVYTYRLINGTEVKVDRLIIRQ